MNQSSSRSSSTERPCGLTALLPLGMSCRGRAEAFARRLHSRLRTLGTQPSESQLATDQNTWLPSTQCNQTASVTNHQPTSVGAVDDMNQDLADYFDSNLPGSPAEETEHTPLINHTELSSPDHACESGYECASPISPIEPNSAAADRSDNSSSDEPFFDLESSEVEQPSGSLSMDYYDCEEAIKDAVAPFVNGYDSVCDNNSISSAEDDSLPKSQSSLSSSVSALTAASTSESSATIANGIDVPDFCAQTESVDARATNHASDAPNSNSSNVDEPKTNGISTADLLHGIGPVQQIPKFDGDNKPALIAENETNGHAATSDDDGEQITRPERLRRCSSLKTGKTPPGTPGRKKIVHFADVLGLDLADVRTFMDDIPKVPTSAYADLQSLLHDDPAPVSLGQRCDKIIMPLFQQPGVQPNFLDIIQRCNVCLENASVTDPLCFKVSGLVRVRNLDFHKSVHVRYSLDAWKSFSDLQAQYVENSCDGFSDKYTFTLYGNSLEVGQRMEIAIRFSCKGTQFWDNNFGFNYCFQCMPATTAQHTQSIGAVNATLAANQLTADSWCGTSFY